MHRPALALHGGSPAVKDKLPQHSVSLPAYQIGKFEVTRGEFRKFIEAGGYTNSRYWSTAGWKWKESDVIDYAGLHGAVTHTVRPNREQPRNVPEHWAAEQQRRRPRGQRLHRIPRGALSDRVPKPMN